MSIVAQTEAVSLGRLLTLESLGLIALILGVIYLGTPRHLRVPAWLGFAAFWLALGQQDAMGDIALVARGTSILAPATILLATWTDPTPHKRNLPRIVYLYPIFGAASIAYVVRAEDWQEAAYFRLAWVLVAVAGLELARTVVDQDSLIRLLSGLMVGLSIGVLLTASSLLFAPDDSFGGVGSSRFRPFGSNPNRISEIYWISAPLALFLAGRSQSSTRQRLLIAIGGLSIVLGVLTASRAAILMLAIGLYPIVAAHATRPRATVAAVMALTALLFYVALGPSVDVETRLTEQYDNRTLTYQDAFAEIQERPFFGILLSSDRTHSQRVGGPDCTTGRASSCVGDSHSSYLGIAHLGGLSLLIPIMAMAVATLAGMGRVLRGSGRLSLPRDLVTYLAGLMVALYTYGIVNNRLFEPVFIQAFLHVFLSALLLSWADEVKRHRTAERRRYQEQRRDRLLRPAISEPNQSQ